MCSEGAVGWLRGVRGHGGPLPRTGVRLLMLLLAAAAAWPPPPAGAEPQLDMLGGLVLLEASMHSTLLMDLQDAAAAAAAAAFPDSSAAVGRVFQVKVPNKMEDVHLGDVKVTEVGKDSLPAWLHWDAGSGVLRGVPLDEDRGVHYISVTVSNRTSSSSSTSSEEEFSIEVHPDEPGDGGPAAAEDPVQPPACSDEEPVTVLTVILDADLTKMGSAQRVELLDRMRSFSGVELQGMKMQPVVNNRLFDMSAFMAGPGNAKKVVENGALLSWKLGCFLDRTTVPDINGVQGPARDGSMSARLGYPVVGWHIANKKPPVAKRVRRQLNVTPTPVLTVLPPSAAADPPVRVVPTLSSPSMAAPTQSSAPPARGPVPLPGKPTIRIRDPVAHTPTLGPPQPTKVVPTTGTVSIQPSVSRTIPAEATATPTVPPRKPPRKPPSTSPKTPPPKAPASSTPSPGLIADPNNRKPVLRNPIDQVVALVGTYFEVKIPSDTFFDKEDGTTDKLRLSLKQNHKDVVGDESWIQFNSTSQLLYGLPDVQHLGKHEFFMQATDKGGRNAVDAFEVKVDRWPANDKTPVVFTARFEGEPRLLTGSVHKKILLVKKLAYVLGDRNSSSVSLRNISRGSVLVEWTNTSLPQQPCPKEQLRNMSRALGDAAGRPTQRFRAHLGPEFSPLEVKVRGRASCRSYSFIPPAEADAAAAPAAATPGPDSGRRRAADDVYLHTVIPAVVVAAVLLVAGVVAMVCYRKKRRGKLTMEDQATFIKKGVPIIFADELDDSKPPPSSSVPLILQDEKPPLPPPEYPAASGPEAAPLSRELLGGEYAALRDEDPNAPPYQPPPPFTAPQEGKGSRPKNMTPYRSPPPYVPP